MGRRGTRRRAAAARAAAPEAAGWFARGEEISDTALDLRVTEGSGGGGTGPGAMAGTRRCGPERRYAAVAAPAAAARPELELRGTIAGARDSRLTSGWTLGRIKTLIGEAVRCRLHDRGHLEVEPP